MYVVSCRRGFDSDRILASQNRYRNYKNPLDSNAFDDLNLTNVLDVARNKHVCILVHGFNNEMQAVMNAYWEVVDRMNKTGVFGAQGYGLVIGFAWPGFSTALGYFTAQGSANRAAPFLMELINKLRGVAHSVDVQTHSLGARVALAALRDPQQAFVDNLLVSAPAVDHHLLEPGRRFFPSTGSCNRCLVYHSKNDPVLNSVYWIGDLSDGVHAALGLAGPRAKAITLAKTTNVYVVDCSARVKTHGGYRKTNPYFQHWKIMLSGVPLERYGEI